MTTQPARDPVAIAQGAFFVATGLWPIVHMRSFERVSGRKRDHWLVKTMGGLIAVVGGTLIAAGMRGRQRETALLGASSASALAASDVIYASRGVISKVYLVDAAAELTIVALWWAQQRTSRKAATRT